MSLLLLVNSCCSARPMQQGATTAPQLFCRCGQTSKPVNKSELRTEEDPDDDDNDDDNDDDDANGGGGGVRHLLSSGRISLSSKLQPPESNFFLRAAFSDCSCFWKRGRGGRFGPRGGGGAGVAGWNVCPTATSKSLATVCALIASGEVLSVARAHPRMPLVPSGRRRMLSA